MKKIILICAVAASTTSFAQQIDSVKKEIIATPTAPKEKSALKFNLNEDGSHFFQATFLNQTWVRWNESNEGTTLFNKYSPSTFDIGLRRTRIQMFGQITDRTFIYFQFGQNNFNNTAAATPTTVGASSVYGNRKIAAFFHDALCEYKVTKGNQLKIGGGLTVLNGLSRFSQPSVGSIMTLDVPVFAQYSVDQIDQFDRRLALYARGQLGKLDYRVYVSNPFPISSSGAGTTLGANSTFVNTAAFKNGYGPGINNQYGGYFAYNFFENETHTTPYMQGTYLGTKKVWNIAVGGVYQKSAMWNLSNKDSVGVYHDTTYADMIHFSVESFLDMPINKEKGTAISAFVGYYNTNYGYNYLRYNGAMNPATGVMPNIGSNQISGNGSTFGNAFPMFGTGQQVYAQIGYLLPKKLLGEGHGQLMPFASAQYADYQRLDHKPMLVIDAGFNWLIKGHNSKISVDFQNRPTFYLDANKDVQSGLRKNCVILQYQILI